MPAYTYQNTLFGVLGCLAAVYLLILAPLYHIAHTESRYDCQRYNAWQYCRQLHTMVHFVRVQLAHSVVSPLCLCVRSESSAYRYRTSSREHLRRRGSF